MVRKLSPFVLIIIIVLVGTALTKQLIKSPGKTIPSVPFPQRFALLLKDTGPGAQNGIVADPPREALKKMEQYAKGFANIEGKAYYRFLEYLGETPNEDRISLSVSSNPFRWRADFSIPSVKTQYVYIFDGNKYYSCFSGSRGSKCSPLPSLDNLSTPIPLTEFLNSLVDPLQLKKFIPGTTESSEATIERTERTILQKSADCTKGNDKYGEVEFCLDKGNGMLLSISLKTKLRRYNIEATNVSDGPLEVNTFSPPYPVN